jgi:hypothetical protein
MSMMQRLVTGSLATAAIVTASIPALPQAPAQAGWAPYVQIYVTDYPEGNGRDQGENIRVCQNRARDSHREARVRRWWFTSTFREGACWTRVPVWEGQ